MQRKKLIKALATVAIGFGAVQVASAADLPPAPYYKAPQAVVAADPWSGFYLGVNAGYSSGRVSRSTSTTILIGVNAGLTDTTSSDNSLAGGVFGGQIGWNWQVNPSWVWGVEVDYQWSGQQFKGGDASSEFFGGGGVPLVLTTTNESNQQKLNSFGTVRLRGGYVVGNSLVYATGGFAYGQVSDFSQGTRTPAAPDAPAFAGSGTVSRTNTGWTAGVGIETKMWSNWSVKFEYLYMDLGSLTNNFTVTATPLGGGAPFAASNFSDNVSFRDHIFRIGLNYAFR